MLLPPLLVVMLASAPPLAGDSSSLRATLYTADVTVKEGLATLQVSLTLENRGSKATEVDVLLELPNEGSAQDFYFTHPGARAWLYGKPLDEDFAEAKYAQLRQRNKATAVPAATMSHVEPGVVRLRIHPARVGVPLQVRFKVQAPLRYEAGRWGVNAEYRVGEDEHGAAQAYTSVTPGLRMTLASKQPGVRVSPDGRRAWVEAAPFDGVQGRVASTALEGGGRITRVALGVAPRLSEPPKGASVVFLLDASRSEDREGIAGQLRVLRRYLRFVPDAQVELIAFRRRAERLFGGFVPVAEVEARLARLTPEQLAPGNGSALDAALALASEALQGRPGALRIVALTDGVARSRAALSAGSVAFPAGTVLHVGLVRVSWTARGSRWAYLDGVKEDHALAPLAEATGGMVLALAPPGEGEAPLVEELVRPTRVRSPQLLAAGRPVPWPHAPESLTEGVGMSDWLRLSGEPGPLELQGRLGARTVRWPLQEDPTLSQGLRSLFGNAPRGAPLSEAERIRATKESGVVGPERPAGAPIVGPVAEQLADGVDAAALGAAAGAAVVDPPDVPTPDAARWLEELLAPALQRCGAAGTVLEVETSFHEVLDVRVTSAPSPASGCLEEAAWALRLPRRFTQEHGRFALNLTTP